MGEMRIYQDACRELNRQKAVCDAQGVADMADEIEAIGELTDWPRLRQLCRRTAATVRIESRGRALYG